MHFDYLSDLSASHSLCLTAELHNARLHVLSSFQYFLLKPVSSARDIASVYSPCYTYNIFIKAYFWRFCNKVFQQFFNPQSLAYIHVSLSLLFKPHIKGVSGSMVRLFLFSFMLSFQRMILVKLTICNLSLSGLSVATFVTSALRLLVCDSVTLCSLCKRLESIISTECHGPP